MRAPSPAAGQRGPCGRRQQGSVPEAASGGDATLEQVLAAVLQVLEPVAGFDACGAQQSLDLAGRVAALLHRMLSGGAGALDVLLSLSHQA